MGEGEVARHLPKNLRVPSLTCGFFDFSPTSRSGMISESVVYCWNMKVNTPDPNTLQNSKLTVANTASNAVPITSVTVAFLSFILSSMGGTTLSRYLPNAVINPLASSSIHDDATITQLMFASPCTRAASDLASSPISEASLILGVDVSNVKRSSRASLRSFHFEDFKLVWSEGDNFGTISTASANARGSRAVGSKTNEGGRSRAVM